MKSIRISFLLIISSFCIQASYAQEKAARISYSMAYFSIDQNAANGVIKCVARPGIIKGSKNATIMFYTQNDVRNIPMKLRMNNKDIAAKRLSPARNSNEEILFSVHAGDIFFTKANKKGYNWTWIGRAKAPLSPLVTNTGGPVKQLKCWYILQVDKQTYLSDTIAIQVK